MTYWVMHRDTFAGDVFPLYGPIENREDAARIAVAAQQEIESRWSGSQSLMDKVSVMDDRQKQRVAGSDTALYET